jgi:hypothetical protein
LKLNYAGTFFYLDQKNSFSIVPQLGFAGEIYESNYQYIQRMRKTSGNVFFGKFGFEVGRDKLSFSANAMLLISQNLTGNNVIALYRWNLNFNYSL